MFEGMIQVRTISILFKLYNYNLQNFTPQQKESWSSVCGESNCREHVFREPARVNNNINNTTYCHIVILPTPKNSSSKIGLFKATLYLIVTHFQCDRMLTEGCVFCSGSLSVPSWEQLATCWIRKQNIFHTVHTLYPFQRRTSWKDSPPARLY